jgi:hypothetical protein
VESAPGEGSLFWVELPVDARVAGPQDRALVVEATGAAAPHTVLTAPPV